MGTWGTQVLENDYVLDMLWELDRKEYVQKFMEEKLTGLDTTGDHIIMLAVSMVDASINGVDEELFEEKFDKDSLVEGEEKHKLYGHYDFFSDLQRDPRYDLVDKAKAAIQYLKNVGVDDWRDDCQDNRMALYDKYEERLNSIKIPKQ